MATSTYVIRGGIEGRERLRLLARVMWPATEALLRRVGVSPTARCVDVGCGGGDVTRELAALASDGYVVGVDMDDSKLDLARAEAGAAGLTNTEFRVLDVLQPLDPELERGTFDVVYARFLLTHLTSPDVALAHMADLLAPGGALVVEDIDFRGHFCVPDHPAFSRYVELYTRVVQSRGADPNIGPRLPSLLAAAGLTDLDMRVVQPAGFEGEVKLMAPITMEAIADAVLAAGLATTDELNQLVDELYEFATTEGTVLSLPRIVQAWGRAGR